MSGDRRRRIAPDSAPEGALRIYTLGRTRLEVGDTPIAGEWLAHRPGALLKYLVTERSRPVPVEELLETFWADGARAGATNVRQAIHTLRDRLDPRREKRAQTQFVVARTGGGGYELDVERVWIDANEFERAARDGLDALHRRDLDEADLLLLEAGALYRGDFLSDEPYADWALNERERLRDMAAHVLRALATLRLERDDAEAAIEPLQRLAELEPFDDRCQRELLEQLLRLGRHADAQRRYQAVRRRFRRAFGADPEWTLNELVGA
jgi:DNA-binding SARP family transcriptional activator